MFMPFRRQSVISTTVWLRLSTTPFCCGDYGVAIYRFTPCSLQKLASTVELNLATTVAPERQQLHVMLVLGDHLDLHLILCAEHIHTHEPVVIIYNKARSIGYRRELPVKSDHRGLHGTVPAGDPPCMTRLLATEFAVFC